MEAAAYCSIRPQLEHCCSRPIEECFLIEAVHALRYTGESIRDALAQTARTPRAGIHAATHRASGRRTPTRIIAHIFFFADETSTPLILASTVFTSTLLLNRALIF